MITREYPEELDCVWLATDRNGSLGAFVTGGAGPIPILAVSEVSLSIEDVEAAICNLPLISEVRLLVPMKRPDSFIELAHRGFFVYDWRDVHRSIHDSTNVYELVAIPLNPLTVSVLPEPLRKLAMEVSLPHVSFAEAASLDVQKNLECLSSRK